MEELADCCVDLERFLRNGNYRRARSWLVGAVDMVDAAIRVRDESKQALSAALHHVEALNEAAGRARNAIAQAAMPTELPVDGKSSRDDGEGPSADNSDDEAPVHEDDDDVPLAVELAGTPPCATGAEAHATSKPTTRGKLRSGRTAASELGPTLGELGALILSATAVGWNRNEDSIPFSVIAKTVDDAKQAAIDAQAKAQEAQRTADALEQAQATLRSRAPSVASTPSKQVEPASALEGASGGKSGSKPHAPAQGGRKSALAAAAVGTRGLSAFGFVAKKAAPDADKNASEDLLFNPFVLGDRLPAQSFTKFWAVPPDSSVDVPASEVTPPTLAAVLNRNELEVGGMGAPRSFNAETLFVLWAHENYVNSEMRPPFLGTWNSTLDTVRMVRPQASSALAEPFSVSRVAGVEYDEDSGDDWDSDGEGTDVGGDEDRSDESEVSNDSFFDDGSDFENDEEREEHAMQKGERDELEARRRRRVAELVPRYEGVFDSMPLSRHPLSHASRVGYATNHHAISVNEGREFNLRIARAIYEAANVAIPDELLTAAEMQLTAAKKAKEAAALAKAAAGVVVRKAKREKPPKPVAAPSDRPAPSAGPTAAQVSAPEPPVDPSRVVRVLRTRKILSPTSAPDTFPPLAQDAPKAVEVVEGGGNAGVSPLPEDPVNQPPRVSSQRSASPPRPIDTAAPSSTTSPPAPYPDPSPLPLAPPSWASAPPAAPKRSRSPARADASAVVSPVAPDTEQAPRLQPIAETA
jgi:hypothetical protein